MSAKKYKHSNHIIQSDASKDNGAWNESSMNFAKDFEKVFDKVMTKWEGKLSLDAITVITNTVIYNKTAFARTFSVKK